jgi:hypothetical protein
MNKITHIFFFTLDNIMATYNMLTTYKYNLTLPKPLSHYTIDSINNIVLFTKSIHDLIESGVSSICLGHYYLEYDFKAPRSISSTK